MEAGRQDERWKGVGWWVRCGRSGWMGKSGERRNEGEMDGASERMRERLVRFEGEGERD
jgi:hypothetical protein